MIALITPTGTRPTQIQLCANFMKHQDYEGEVLWVIIDDGNPSTTNFIPVDFKKNWKIVKLYPGVKWKFGMNTQCSNLLEGLKIVKKYNNIDLIFIIEDDDYYSSQYLRKMYEKLDSCVLIGEQFSFYYNPVRRGYLLNRNTTHSSLFQTAFVPSLIPTVEKICSAKVKFVDVRLYKKSEIPAEKIKFFSGENLAIGIKGMPGRFGIGIGHRPHLHLVPDPDMDKLKELIGNDYIYYMKYYKS